MTARRLRAVAGLGLALLAGCASAPRAGTPLERARPLEPPSARFVVAHRGAHLVAPENSLAAIRDAARLGATHAEVDVRTTRDGELVLLHDADTDRTTNGTGAVAALTLAEIRALRLQLPDGTLSAEKVPTFAEALETAERAGVGLYLDVKDVTAERLAAALRRSDAHHHLVYKGDFAWLARFHELAPAFVVLADCRDADEIRDVAARLGSCEFASSFKRFAPDHAAAAHALGAGVIVDVLGLDENLERRVSEALRRGADGVQTDDPARVRALLASGR